MLTILAGGPLLAGGASREVQRLCGDRLYFYDAIAPIVEAESIDWERCFRASRYDKGKATPEAEGDYVGRGVHEAARIVELAGADEILASAETVESTRHAVDGSPARAVTLRGMPERVELVMVNPPPTPPAGSDALARL